VIPSEDGGSSFSEFLVFVCVCECTRLYGFTSQKISILRYQHCDNLRPHNETFVSELISRIFIFCFRMEISWYESPRAHLASMYWLVCKEGSRNIFC